MRSPRSVVCAPIGMPSRSLNWAMDLRALVTMGFWPVISVRSRTAPSISLESLAASPTPMFTTTLTRRGICMTLPYLNSCCRDSRISPAYWPSGAAESSQLLQSLECLSGSLGVANTHGLLYAVLLDGFHAEADAGRLLGLRVDDSDVGSVQRGFDNLDAAGLGTAGGLADLGVLGDAV